MLLFLLMEALDPHTETRVFWERGDDGTEPAYIQDTPLEKAFFSPKEGGDNFKNRCDLWETV